MSRRTGGEGKMCLVMMISFVLLLMIITLLFFEVTAVAVKNIYLSVPRAR